MAADARAGRCLRRRECRVYTQSISRREPLAGLKALKGIPLVGQHSPKGSGPSFQPHPFFSRCMRHASRLSSLPQSRRGPWTPVTVRYVHTRGQLNCENGRLCKAGNKGIPDVCAVCRADCRVTAVVKVAHRFTCLSGCCGTPLADTSCMPRTTSASISSTSRARGVPKSTKYAARLFRLAADRD